MTATRIGKFAHYRQLLDRIDQAYSAGFFLECVWISYAFLEGRIDSVVSKEGISFNKKRPMFGDKMQAVIAHHPTSPLLGQAIDLVELGRVVAWKDRRNRLMHELADDLRPWADLNAEIKDLAKEGRDLSRAFAASVRRYKRRWQKAHENPGT